MVEKLIRPIWDDDMRHELAQIVGEAVNKWCDDETPLDDCVESAHRILDWHSNDNGYELAKEFEDDGFSPDADLVEILDGVSYDKGNIVQEHIKMWVINNNLTLDLTEGQKVVTKIYRKGEVECEIVKLYPETMQYGVWYDGQGSARGLGHTIIGAENILSVLTEINNSNQ